ncbi:hypothetical protein VHEMI04457 [[Torrubiella] hemipterigena]|uniref:C2H2-type domain-containing protein n=1 Tax=[Torrubiella] hemipterigena TaxID=1531966 RepID=A0A0A1TEB6_9HYPO|nr:hypothetical protein VHEMI04457 [[Torrubiella] hemipterigena]
MIAAHRYISVDDQQNINSPHYININNRTNNNTTTATSTATLTQSSPSHTTTTLDTLEPTLDLQIDQWAASQPDLGNWDFLDAESRDLDDAAMQSDAGGIFTQFAPGRSHQRESSLSSMGSIGPASPYAQNSSNPHIAITDVPIDGLHDVQVADMTANQGAAFYYPGAKAAAAFDAFHDLEGVQDFSFAAPTTINGKARFDRSLLPAPEMGHRQKRSHPASAASSAAGDSPMTPMPGEGEQAGKRRRAAYGNVPKLERSITDVYGDELYSPNFTIISSSPTMSHTATSPSSQIFNQCISAAANQHLSTGQSPSSSTSRLSPYQAMSPFAAPTQLGSTQQANMLRQQQQQQQSNFSLQGSADNMDTPKTISPKDALLDFNDDGNNFPLFSQPSSASFDFGQLGNLMMPARLDDFTNSQVSYDNRIPQQYPFVPRPTDEQRHPISLPLAPAPAPVTAPRKSVASEASITKPANVAADGGTYTCTYHGCTLRFESPALLQKHKREGHRQQQNGHGSSVQENSNVPGALNTQAGPHRCDRINPSTGKPCQSIFSRPYDLTRHEDTIHNARKMKVRCDLCTEEKSFSRADALTRHYRVCHPEVDLPGKQRRRAV